MPGQCYIPNCWSGHPTNPIKRNYFSPPKDPVLREEWRKMIPRDVPAIHKSARICELHFEEEDLIKGNTYIIDGKTSFLPMKWKLKKGALPRIFPGCPSYLNKPSKRRKPPMDRSGIRAKTEENNVKTCDSAVEEKLSVKEDSQNRKFTDTNKEHVTNVSTEEKMPMNEHSQSQAGSPTSEINLRAVRLPSIFWSWLVNEEKESKLPIHESVVCSENCALEDSKTYPRRSIKFDLKLGQAIYYLYGLKIDYLPASFKTTFSSEDDISNLLSKFHAAKLCLGFPVSLFPGVELSRYGPIKGQSVCSLKCSGISEHCYKPCLNCRTMKYAIQRVKSRKDNKIKREAGTVEASSYLKPLNVELEAAKKGLPVNKVIRVDMS